MSMSVVDEVVQVLEEYAGVLSAIESNKLHSKVSGIRKHIQGLRSLKDYVTKIEVEVEALSSPSTHTAIVKKVKKTEKQLVLGYNVILGKVKGGQPLTEEEKEEARELRAKYPRIIDLAEGRSAVKEVLAAQSLERWTATELRLLYGLVFQEYYAGTKKELIASLHQYKSRLDYYHAFEKQLPV